MSVLSIDFETRSTVDLKKTGVYPYAAHPSTDVICMAWAFDDEEPQIWVPWRGELFDGSEVAEDSAFLPFRIVEHIEQGGEVRGWNANGFERHIWREIMVPRYVAPPVRDEQWFDTMAEARAMSLPGALEQAAKVCGLLQQKDDKGYRLMLQMSKPRRIEPDGTIVWWETPERLEKLYEYCKQDVRTERAVAKVIRRLSDHERDIFLLDQRINDRGVRFDRQLIDAAQIIADIGTERANVVLRQLTNGAVTTVTNHKQLTEWLQANGVETDGVSKPVVTELLEGDLTDTVREALEARADAGRTSVAKLKAMLDAMGADDRVRGMLAYHVASTARWGGRLVQPQNFPRGTVKGVEELIPLVLAHDYDTLSLVEHPIVVVSAMLRSMMTAAPGYELLVADFASIEAVVVNWLAGQTDVLDDFRAYLAGDKARDPYRKMAVRMGRALTPMAVVPIDRTAGKAAELGCGFGMGPDKFVSAAWKTYQVRVTPEQAKDAVRIYRDSHPMVKRFWYETERAVIAAIETPNVARWFGPLNNLRAIVAGAYLYVVLPSGRLMVYPQPRVVMAAPPWGGPDKPQIEYSSVNAVTQQWGRERTYGGKLVENIVQAVARDLMADALLRAEARGYTPVLSVHDEAIAEVPAGFGSVEEFEQIVAEAPAWATGCPIKAEGWRGVRYKK